MASDFRLLADGTSKRLLSNGSDKRILASSTVGGVPDPPTSAVGTRGNGQVSVAFTPPVNGGSSAIIDYTAISTPGSFTATGSGSPLVVTGLANGTAYTFTVHARNTQGNSSESVASAAVTPATVPGAPTGVTAAAGNASAVVTFSAPASTGGDAITGYTVTASTGPTGTGAGSPITVSGLTNGVAVTFTVTATNTVGTGAASSASTPAVYPGVVVTIGKLAPVQIAATGYTVYRFVNGALVADGPRITAGLRAVASVTNGIEALVSTTADADGGMRGVNVYDNGSTFIAQPLYIPPANRHGALVSVAPFLSGDTIGTPGFTLSKLAASGTLTAGTRTAAAAAISGVTNGYAISYTPALDADGGFHGCGQWDDGNGNYYPAEEINVCGTSPVLAKVAPFLTTDFVVGKTPGYQLYELLAASIPTVGSRVTTMTAIPHQLMGFIAWIDLTAQADTDGGVRGVINWDNGDTTPAYRPDVLNALPLLGGGTVASVAPFLTTDTMSTPGWRTYKLSSSAITADGARITANVQTIPNATNGRAALLTPTLDGDSNYRGEVTWDTGGGGAVFYADEVDVWASSAVGGSSDSGVTGAGVGRGRLRRGLGVGKLQRGLQVA